MAGSQGPDEQPRVFDAKKLAAAGKRKRSESPGKRPSNSSPYASALKAHDSLPGRPQRPDDYDGSKGLPQPFDARSLEPAKKRPRSRSPGAGSRISTPVSAAESTVASTTTPLKPKRPGQRARITEAEREAIRQRALGRERAAAADGTEERRHIDDVVRSHYNSVPERGREWRKTASTIRGLRSFNNWVKSSPELLVLDIGCGKGGDLGKWAQAPQRVRLYVGLDPAEVSISQARERYREMTQRGGGGGGGRGGGHRGAQIFDARFHIKDCFSESIGDVAEVREVGFDGGPLSRRGFDVVSMMFCMHYAFESEEKARRMLANVSGALKKGGRFLGCIPNSDVIGQRVHEFNESLAERKKREREGREKKEEEDEGGKKKEGNTRGEGEEGDTEEGEVEDTAEWGNDIYRVRFPGATPGDGIFRPPFGWKYNFYLSEAVDEVPEYVVPWHAFRALAEDYNLELQYQKAFGEIWEAEKDDAVLGPLSERMGVRDRYTRGLAVTPPEMEAANFYLAFCFYKV